MGRERNKGTDRPTAATAVKKGSSTTEFACKWIFVTFSPDAASNIELVVRE